MLMIVVSKSTKINKNHHLGNVSYSHQDQEHENSHNQQKQGSNNNQAFGDLMCQCEQDRGGVLNSCGAATRFPWIEKIKNTELIRTDRGRIVWSNYEVADQIWTRWHSSTSVAAAEIKWLTLVALITDRENGRVIISGSSDHRWQRWSSDIAASRGKRRTLTTVLVVNSFELSKLLQWGVDQSCWGVSG